MNNGIAGDAASDATVLFKSDSADEVVEFCQQYVDSIEITTLDSRRGKLGYRHRVDIFGPISLNETYYARDVRLSLVETAAKYRISLPLNGQMEYERGRASGMVDTASAAIFMPGDSVAVKRWPGHTSVLSIKLDRAVVDSALAGMIGGPASRPVSFSSAMSLKTGPAAAWMRLASDLWHLRSLLENPLIAAPFADSLARGLLLSAHHTYSKVLEQAARVPKPAVVRNAIDYIEENASTPLTISQISRHCHVSTRTLQNAFRSHVGMSPLQYARRIRLGKLHTELKVSDPDSITVSSAAHRWGFLHMGRLAAEYRSIYGELPVRTLKSSI
jgi:AraC-like DNA-binding protein